MLAGRWGEVGAMGAGPGGGARGGPEDPPVLGMPCACSVRRWLGGAAAHLISAAVSVGGSRVEDLGHHCWSEAVRGLVACWADIFLLQSGHKEANESRWHRCSKGHSRTSLVDSCADLVLFARKSAAASRAMAWPRHA